MQTSIEHDQRCVGISILDTLLIKLTSVIVDYLVYFERRNLWSLGHNDMSVPKTAIVDQREVQAMLTQPLDS